MHRVRQQKPILSSPSHASTRIQRMREMPNRYCVKVFVLGQVRAIPAEVAGDRRARHSLQTRSTKATPELSLRQEAMLQEQVSSSTQSKIQWWIFHFPHCSQHSSQNSAQQSSVDRSFATGKKFLVAAELQQESGRPRHQRVADQKIQARLQQRL